MVDPTGTMMPLGLLGILSTFALVWYVGERVATRREIKRLQREAARLRVHAAHWRTLSMSWQREAPWMECGGAAEAAVRCAHRAEEATAEALECERKAARAARGRV